MTGAEPDLFVILVVYDGIFGKPMPEGADRHLFEATLYAGAAPYYPMLYFVSAIADQFGFLIIKVPKYYILIAPLFKEPGILSNLPPHLEDLRNILEILDQAMDKARAMVKPEDAERWLKMDPDLIVGYARPVDRLSGAIIAREGAIQSIVENGQELETRIIPYFEKGKLRGAKH